MDDECSIYRIDGATRTLLPGGYASREDAEAEIDRRVERGDPDAAQLVVICHSEDDGPRPV
jgi:hypothetical protein